MPLRLPASLLSLSLASLVLAGCGSIATFPTSDAISPVASGASLQGTVHGGQGPIAGAHIHLMAASTSGYAAAASSLLTSSTGYSDSIGYYVPSSSTGQWTITGDYTCTSGQIVYALATQGNPGLPGNVNNTAIALIAVLGVCPGPTFSSALTLNIDEATTVAAAYALAGFMTGPTNLGAPNNTLAQSGITNAANNAAFLVSASTGKPLATTPNTLGTVPFAELSTLSNLLAYCVNSDGTTNCTSLFSLTPNSSSVTPTDTTTAILNIAHNPAANVAALYTLVGAVGDPFPGSLTTQPADWSVQIDYAIGLSFTSDDEGANIAIDDLGDIWVPTFAGSHEFSPAGAPLATNTSQKGGRSIAVSPINGSVWDAGDSLYDGTSKEADSATNYAGDEQEVAFDASGRAWTANYGPISPRTTVGEFSGSSAVLDSGYTSGGLSDATGVTANGIAIDSQNDIWVINRDSNIATEMTSGGVAISPSTGDSTASIRPGYIAIDGSDNAWMLSAFGTSNAMVFSKTSKLLSGAGWPTNGSVTGATEIAFDGSGLAWITGGITTPALYSVNGSGLLTSPSTGFKTVDALPYSVAVDPSGNVWLFDAGMNDLVAVIGIATPAVTPITPGKLATRP